MIDDLANKRRAKIWDGATVIDQKKPLQKQLQGQQKEIAPNNRFERLGNSTYFQNRFEDTDLE